MPFRSVFNKSKGKLVNTYSSEIPKSGGDRRGPFISITGGTKFTDGGQTYHLFTVDTPAEDSVLVIDAANQTKTMKILAIGGGGNGGLDDAGGGGAGSVVYDSGFESGLNSFQITVGSGGAGGNSSYGYKGEDTLFGTVLTAKGGGSGHKNEPGPQKATIGGGSGGGGGYPTGPATPYGAPGNLPGTATSYQNSGANASPPNVQGGGGGGAGNAGSGNGAGGAGIQMPEFPRSVIAPQLPGPEQTDFNNALTANNYYAGGGAGGGRVAQRTGGTGGGGPGGYPGVAQGQAGAKHTGSGGGGTGAGGSPYGLGGGSGIVIVKYPS